MKKIRICQVCGRYTLAMLHCGQTSASAHPPRYDPNDRYGRQRREWKGV